MISSDRTMREEGYKSVHIINEGKAGQRERKLTEKRRVESEGCSAVASPRRLEAERLVDLPLYTLMLYERMEATKKGKSR